MNQEELNIYEENLMVYWTNHAVMDYKEEKGFDSCLIAETTGLSVDEIERLK